MQIHGWMKRFLVLNEQYEERNQDVSSACPRSRDMTIHNLIRRGDDRAARCMLEVRLY